MRGITASTAHRLIAAAATAIVVAGFAILPAKTAVNRYYGLYRGVVVANVDPLDEGRVQIEVPDVSGANVTGWALPVLHDPYTTKNLKVPQIGQGVWIEYEQGNVSYPVWLGVIPRPQ